MPEATVHEHSDLSASKSDVDAPSPVSGHGPVNPVSEPGIVEEMPQLQLRAGIAATVGLHISSHRRRTGPRRRRTATGPTRRCDAISGRTLIHASSVLQEESGHSNIETRGRSDGTMQGGRDRPLLGTAGARLWSRSPTASSGWHKTDLQLRSRGWASSGDS
jgi:hypothetical protein